MPRTEVVFYQDEEDVPVLDWLKELRRADIRAHERCVAAIERLAELGHELRRPLADILRDGIYELRIRKGRVNYRIHPTSILRETATIRKKAEFQHSIHILVNSSITT